MVVRFLGRVQGVGFRATVLQHANGLDVHGFVRNEIDGSVLLDVDGERNVLKELLCRIEQQPAGRIDACDVSWHQPSSRDGGLAIKF
ncbi:MAG: acylphosphatase [Planctomycetota bacterium]